MRGRRRFDLLAAVLVACAAPRASADEPDATAPSVCAPPCPAGQTCVGHMCVTWVRNSPPPAAATAPAQAPPQTPATPAPPPQGYPPYPANRPPPPPGYPYPAQPPGASYPPPQPGYYYPPQSGTTYPPPGAYYYPPPPGAYPPRPVVYGQPPAPLRKHRFFALPFLGIHSYQHKEAASYDPGARLGALLGGRLNDTASLNAELSLDVANRHDAPPGDREWTATFAFSPMFELPAGPVEVVLGPKLGLFVLEASQSDTGTLGSVISGEVTGWDAGLHAGAFMPVSPRASLGLLLSFDLLWAEHACVTYSGYGQVCGSATSSNTVKVLGVTGAALF